VTGQEDHANVATIAGSPSLIRLAVSCAAEMSIVSSAASNADHAAPPTLTALSFPAWPTGARSRSRMPPAGAAVANDDGSVTFAHTEYAPAASAASDGGGGVMLNEMRP